jgi:serine/threonine-protein kinase PknG
MRDPTASLLHDPVVPVRERFCSNTDCREPVGRPDDATPGGRRRGFCRRCRTPFSFDPALRAGDLVAGQYEVTGCIARGGIGWIYLAKDLFVGDDEIVRWVALKGIRDGDGWGAQVAVAERRFLATVDHPNIVKILNVTQHGDAAYIVMEYLAGVSLQRELDDRRRSNGGRPDPFPASVACEYVLQILPAIAYLHDRALLYCDFKPDNVIATSHGLTLIDLGAVFRLGERGAFYGTRGYQAPEIEETGPTVASDLYTIGRTLAMLTTGFSALDSEYRWTLPGPDVIPLFAEHDSLYRFLLKATAPDPDRRFESAADMADQLHGVLLELVAPSLGGIATQSRRFTPDLRARPDAPDWRLLPTLRVAPEDEASGFLETLARMEPDAVLFQLDHAPIATAETSLRRVHALIALERWQDVEAELDAFDAALVSPDDADRRTVAEESRSGDWRAEWCRGVAALARGDEIAARVRFTSVYHELPGELAPKLAIGVAAEYAGDVEAAVGWYEVVSRTDSSYTTAVFGLARSRLAGGDPDGAIEALVRVRSHSISYGDALVERAYAMLAPPTPPRTRSVDDIIRAAATVEDLGTHDPRAAELTAAVLEAALHLLVNGEPPQPELTLVGVPFTEASARFGLEATYRRLARSATTSSQRIRLVDEANAVRPRTLT